MKKIILALLFLTFSLQISADNLSDSNTLFAWAEETYPTIFTPKAETVQANTLIYRYYSATGTYFGTIGQEVYIYSPSLFGGDVLRLGVISDFVQTYFKFTTDYLNGRTLYQVTTDPDIPEWEIIAYTFADTVLSIVVHQSTNHAGITMDNISYSITDEGYIFIEEDDEYIKVIGETDDFLNIIWLDDNFNVTDEDEYFFFDLQKAKDFVAEKSSTK